MLLTAFILGLAGSFHCAGMCSPLAFAVTGMKRSAIINRVWYNTGRILVYGVLGIVVSTIGVALPLERFQNGLSIGMGIILVIAGVVGTAWVRIPHNSNPFYTLTSWLKNRFSKLIQKKSPLSIFFMGALNGLLPCGLTLIALTSCLILPTSTDGFYFMLLFGAGTLPVMLGFTSVVKFLTDYFRISFQRVNTIMLVIAGSLLIAQASLNHNHPVSISKTGEIEICR